MKSDIKRYVLSPKKEKASISYLVDDSSYNIIMFVIT